MTEKFVSPCLPPTPRQAEILTVAAEECAEIIQRIAKALRFGLDEAQPGQDRTNAERIVAEACDLAATMALAFEEGVLPFDEERMDDMVEAKRRKLAAYLQTEADSNG